MGAIKFKRDFENQAKLENVRQTMKVTCKCGKRNSFYAFEDDYKLCSWCHRYVFRNKKTEFEFRLKEQMIRSKRGELII